MTIREHQLLVVDHNLAAALEAIALELGVFCDRVTEGDAKFAALLSRVEVQLAVEPWFGVSVQAIVSMTWRNATGSPTWAREVLDACFLDTHGTDTREALEAAYRLAGNNGVKSLLKEIVDRAHMRVLRRAT